MKAIGYGRISTPDQKTQKRYGRQIWEIKSQFNLSTLDFDYDETSKKPRFLDRTALQRQLGKAASHGVPLLMEHSDRLIKSYDDALIDTFRRGIGQFGADIRYAYPNTSVHGCVAGILLANQPVSVKRRRLVRVVDQYLKHRHLIIFPDGNPDALPTLEPFSSLRDFQYFPALVRCANRLLLLSPSSPGFAFFVDAYLGNAYNRKGRLLRGTLQFVPGGQRTYPSCPEHLELFAAIHRLEMQPLFTLTGKPKPVSNQKVAEAINDLGFRNFRGNRFLRKSIWELRRKPSYRRFVQTPPDYSFLVPPKS